VLHCCTAVPPEPCGQPSRYIDVLCGILWMMGWKSAFTLRLCLWLATGNRHRREASSVRQSDAHFPDCMPIRFPHH
jgi:hypothetical protein